MDWEIRKATENDQDAVWEILKSAIERRKAEGSNQWQDGYPNPEAIAADLKREVGYVITRGGEIAGYFAALINDEPEYTRIRGQWRTNGDFYVLHRIAVSGRYLRNGLAQKIFSWVEQKALQEGILSIRVDTNFDNHSMLHIFDKLGFKYCGEVYFRGSPRLAYEKILEKKPAGGDF